MGVLLAVDLGLHTGLAVCGDGGRLQSVRSLHIGSMPRLRTAVPALLHSLPAVTHVVLEGGGAVANVWLREVERRGLCVRLISAETWRARLLLPREQRHAAEAKEAAAEVARQMIAWSGLPQPRTLRHDAAEAVLVALWALVELAWPVPPPADLPERLRGYRPPQL